MNHRSARLLLALAALLVLLTVLFTSCRNEPDTTTVTNTSDTIPITNETTSTPNSPTTTAPTPPANDLILPEIHDANGLMWYEFNEENGATVLKSSLSQPRDSIHFSGSLEKTGGYDGRSYVIFEGGGDGIKLNNTFGDFAQITENTFLHPARETLSVSFHIYPDSLDENAMLFEYGSRYRGFAIAIIDGALTCSVTAGNALDGDGTRIDLTAYPLPETALTEWSEIVFSFDGSLDGGTASLYVNRMMVASENGVGKYLPQVLDASGVATTAHGTNSLELYDIPYRGKMDDLRIYKIPMTPIPTLEESAIYLQSAAAKNHYIKASGASVAVASMVEPALRGVIVEKGLADTAAVSLRMSGTKRYISYQNGAFTALSLADGLDEKSATFYIEDALALPTWGKHANESFKSFRLMETNSYIASNGSSLVLSDPTNTEEKLSASFKLTGDQTATVEALRGAIYYPSYALNAPQFFKWYDSAIIDRDMQYAKTLGINAFRIWVSYEYWLENPLHFKASYDDFLSLADEYGIKVMVSLFEGCGKAEEGYESENVWSRDYTKAWSITSPGREIYNDPSRWNEPKAFVTWFFETYKNDSRHLAIEIYNEPWDNREGLAKYLSEYAVSIQGSVPITFGTAPAGSYTIAYSVTKGADLLQYHDNFPESPDAFYQNALARIEEGRLANLPVYCTEIQWVGGPANINYPLYENLAPTVNTLTKTKVWAPFYWTLMVHPCYLDSYRNNYHMKNGIIGEDGSYYSIKNAQAIAPEADLSDAVENSHNPYDDKAYRYRYLFSEDFSDQNAYKWTVKSGEFSAKDGYFAGQGIAFANATDFRDFTATFTVNSEKEAGLIFRAQDDKNYYLAAVSKAAFILYRVENGVKRVLASAIPEDAGNTVTVTVYVKNDEMRISANCTDCTAVDTAYVSGEIGFYSADLAIFDTLRVSYIAE